MGAPLVKFTSLDDTVADRDRGLDIVEIFGALNQADWSFGKGFVATSITAFDVYDEDNPGQRLRRRAAARLEGKPEAGAAGGQPGAAARLAQGTARPVSPLAGAFVYHQTTDFTQAIHLTSLAERRLTPIGRPKADRQRPLSIPPHDRQPGAVRTGDLECDPGLPA